MYLLTKIFPGTAKSICTQYSTCNSAQEDPSHVFVFENTPPKLFHLQNHLQKQQLRQDMKMMPIREI